MAIGFGTTSGSASTNIFSAGSITLPSNVSIAARVLRNSVTTAPRIIDWGGASGIILYTNNASLNYERATSGTLGKWTESGSMANSTQYAVVVTQAGTASPVYYINNATPSVSTTQSPTGTETTTAQNADIGNRSDLIRVWDGKIGDVAIWNVVLTAAEAGAYYDGVSPLLIRPESLLGYWPMMGVTDTRNMVGAKATMSGGATQAHPRTIFPGRIQRYAAAQAASGNAPLAMRHLMNMMRA